LLKNPKPSAQASRRQQEDLNSRKTAAQGRPQPKEGLSTRRSPRDKNPIAHRGFERAASITNLIKSKLKRSFFQEIRGRQQYQQEAISAIENAA
jgi:hypothetical protein